MRWEIGKRKSGRAPLSRILPYRITSFPSLLRFGNRPGSLRFSTLPEERRQDSAALRFGDELDREAVIRPRVFVKRVAETERAALRVLRAVNDARYAGLLASGEAHRTRLERDVEDAVLESPTPEAFRAVFERVDLRVGGRRLESLAGVSPFADDFPAVDEHGADGDFVLGSGDFRFVERGAEIPKVGSPAILRTVLAQDARSLPESASFVVSPSRWFFNFAIF